MSRKIITNLMRVITIKMPQKDSEKAPSISFASRLLFWIIGHNILNRIMAMAMSLAKGKISMLISMVNRQSLCPCPWRMGNPNLHVHGERANPMPMSMANGQSQSPWRTESHARPGPQRHCRGGGHAKKAMIRKLSEKDWSRLCIRSLIQQKII